MTSKLIIAHLSHDLQAQKSYVSYLWDGDPSKRLNLEVPFGTGLDDVEAEAATALLTLSDELKSAEITLPA